MKLFPTNDFSRNIVFSNPANFQKMDHTDQKLESHFTIMLILLFTDDYLDDVLTNRQGLPSHRSQFLHNRVHPLQGNLSPFIFCFFSISELFLLILASLNFYQFKMCRVYTQTVAALLLHQATVRDRIDKCSIACRLGTDHLYGIISLLLLQATIAAI